MKNAGISYSMEEKSSSSAPAVHETMGSVRETSAEEEVGDQETAADPLSVDPVFCDRRCDAAGGGRHPAADGAVHCTVGFLQF